MQRRKGWRRRTAAITAIVAALGLAIAPAGVASGPAAVHRAVGPVTVEGRYGVLHADPSVEPDVDVLQSGVATYRLRFAASGVTRPAPGTAVLVTGRLTGQKSRGGPVIAVRRIEPAPAPAAGAPWTAPLRAGPLLATSGDVSVLVVLVQWSGADAVTPDSARQQILVDDAAWLKEASYGRVNLIGDVTPWLKIAAPATSCDFTDIGTKAQQAALTAGFHADVYDRVVIYMPRQDCSGIAGQAMIGGPMAWINGSLDRRVTVHELGHTFGLYHAHLLRCSAGGAEVTLAASGCQTVEYGDPFDAMGDTDYVGHFSAAQKGQLGWLGPRVADLTTSPTVTLTPFELDTGATVAARLTVPSGRAYWFEYRQAVGFDAALPASASDGVLVHMLDSPTAPGPDLLDQRTVPPSDAEDAPLPFGTQWTTPEGWAITATAVDGGVRLDATRPAGPPPPPPPPPPALPTLSVNDVSVKEGNTGTTSVTFTITRTGPLAAASSVSYKTANGTATAGKDYVAVALKKLTFAAGEQTKSVTVVIKNDRKKEKNETFSLNLSKPVAAKILHGTGVATIINND